MYRFKHIILPLILTIIILITGISLTYLYYMDWKEHALSGNQDFVEVVQHSDEQSEEVDLQSIIHDAEKHVVQIETTGPFGRNIGSGFVYNEQGDIVTNAHVVKNASEIYVKTSQAENYIGAIIGIGDDEDIALIRVPQLANNGALTIDSSIEPSIGDEIIAIGSPHGFQNTVTLGIISALDRSFTVDDYDYTNLYQITADISRGNSGGPLIHRQSGNVIGINSAASTEGDIGFSIPISQVYERLLMWSDTANNEDLNYEGDPNTLTTLTDEQLIREADYLINYFYETLNLRDYFTAYSLLGSDEQKNYTYPEFRELFVTAERIEIKDLDVEILNNNRASVTILSDHILLRENEIEEIHHYESNFTVGYENDQLKILQFNQSLLSKTELQKEQENDDQQRTD